MDEYVGDIRQRVLERMDLSREMSDEEIENLIYVAQNCKLQVGDLLYSGILIASLGAVMDVAMSISSTIQEIHDRNPEISKKELFKSGIHVGKDMMGTMSNTLILAFTGSSLNTMIMIYAYSYPYNQMINMYSIGIELLLSLIHISEPTRP